MNQSLINSYNSISACLGSAKEDQHKQVLARITILVSIQMCVNHQGQHVKRSNSCTLISLRSIIQRTHVCVCVLAHVTINVISPHYLCPSSLSIISTLMEDDRDYVLMQSQMAVRAGAPTQMHTYSSRIIITEL